MSWGALELLRNSQRLEVRLRGAEEVKVAYLDSISPLRKAFFIVLVELKTYWVSEWLLIIFCSNED